MAFSAAPLPAPSIEEVQSIGELEDPVIRNLRITECYSRLSAAMTGQIGMSANWCTFATWASRQAGCTIRGEDMMDRLAQHTVTGATLRRPVNWCWRRVLQHGLLNPNTRLGRMVREIHSPFDAIELASDAVSRGNRKVFQEIGLQFARYLACGEAFDEFLAGLRPGHAPDGQDLLRSAFRRYRFRAHEPQQILLANLEIGVHEQTRLQPEIQEALEAVPEMKERLSPWTRYFTRGYRQLVRDLVRQVVTESLMVLELPGSVLSVGRHLETPVPEALRNLDDPDLMALLEQFEPHGSTCTNCGADDWGDLRQRMHYILNLFRAFHFDGRLFNPPFDSGQREFILKGKVPAGKL